MVLNNFLILILQNVPLGQHITDALRHLYLQPIHSCIIHKDQMEGEMTKPIERHVVSSQFNGLHGRHLRVAAESVSPYL